MFGDLGFWRFRDLGFWGGGGGDGKFWRIPKMEIWRFGILGFGILEISEFHNFRISQFQDFTISQFQILGF